MRTFILASILVFVGTMANAGEPLKKYGIVLLQPDQVLEQRLQSVEALATYITAVERAVSLSLDAQPSAGAAGGFLVVAIRPGQRSNAWLTFSPELSTELSTLVVKSIRSVLPPRVNDGPVVFAIKVGLWGGNEPSEVTPAPKEFSAAAVQAGRSLEVSEVVERLWRE
jgi:hypothetical protein